MSLQPFEVSAPIDDFIDPRLQKQNRQKSGGENLHQVSCFGHPQNCNHERSLAETARICRCPDLRPQKTGTRSPASLLRRTTSRCRLLRADVRVIREMQIVVALTVEVNPPLDRATYCCTHRDRERGRTASRYRHAGWNGDCGVAVAQGATVVDRWHGSPKRIRRKLRRRDVKRLGAAGWVVQCNRNWSRMTNGDAAETRRNRIHPCCCVCGYGEVLTPCTLRRRTDVVKAGRGILDYQIGAVHERRLNLRRRPVWIELQEHRCRPSDVRRLHH